MKSKTVSSLYPHGRILASLRKEGNSDPSHGWDGPETRCRQRPALRGPLTGRPWSSHVRRDGTETVGPGPGVEVGECPVWEDGKVPQTDGGDGLAAS